VPQRLRYALAGAVLSIGAPLGLLLLRLLHSPQVSLAGMGEEIVRDTATYAYVTVSTLVVFTLFGLALGRQADRLSDLSKRDPLTGLLNARVFRERLEQEVERVARYGWPLSLLIIDLDGLKQINDERGHRSGDEALMGVGAAIRRAARVTDLAARWGGDEFAVLAPNTSTDAAVPLGERIRAVVAETSRLTIPFTVSIGAATLDPCAGKGTADSLWERADSALYEAKRRGRNCIASSPC
jgi:diguanylate cyclase (GGDEF)-like protein